jgi:hypothetical protein
MRDGVGHLVERRQVVVRIGVTREVVAGVVRLPCRSTVRLGLRFGLESLRSGEEAAGGNPLSDERA